MALISMVRPQILPFGGKKVPGVSPRTEVEMSGSEFLSQLAENPVTEQNKQSRVSVNPQSGEYALLQGNAKVPEGQQILPLRFGSLQKALSEIGDSQPWLMGGQPILKTENNGNARIDFMNRGGFVFNQQGDYVSHAVNAW